MVWFVGIHTIVSVENPDLQNQLTFEVLLPCRNFASRRFWKLAFRHSSSLNTCATDPCGNQLRVPHSLNGQSAEFNFGIDLKQTFGERADERIVDVFTTAGRFSRLRKIIRQLPTNMSSTNGLKV
jgi:hypothetical protein